LRHGGIKSVRDPNPASKRSHCIARSRLATGLPGRSIVLRRPSLPSFPVGLRVLLFSVVRRPASGYGYLISFVYTSPGVNCPRCIRGSRQPSPWFIRDYGAAGRPRFAVPPGPDAIREMDWGAVPGDYDFSSSSSSSSSGSIS
jgi:hypothetical protein